MDLTRKNGLFFHYQGTRALFPTVMTQLLDLKVWSKIMPGLKFGSIQFKDNFHNEPKINFGSKYQARLKASEQAAL